MDYANESMQNAAESTYSTFAGLVSSLYTDSSSVGSGTGDPSMERRDTSIGESDDLVSLRNRRSSAIRRVSAADLAWIFKNPYNSVRGRHDHPSSMSAVRSLLPLVPVDEERLDAVPEAGFFSWGETVPAEHEPLTSPMGEASLDTSWAEFDRNRKNPVKKAVSSQETASQLAEGTIRALRDMALDEAVELHEALRFWSVRWERPVLSWLEAGPKGTYALKVLVGWICVCACFRID
jgi:hypothetical protein